ncbi:MAG: beta-ketoacyl synthase N-terminal-like domain-containing protein [Dehalococcoidia bacterium]
MPEQPRGAVITGIGVVTAAGSGVAAAWERLTARTAAGEPWSPDGDEPTFQAAPVPESYRPHPEIPRNLIHVLDRGALFAMDAALQAVESAGLGAGSGDARRFAVVDGLAYRAPGQATLFVPYGQTVARMFGVRGTVLEVGGAEASGLVAIATACRMVERGEAEVVIAGAAQGLQRPLLDHLRAQGFASREPGRPFDAAHAGATPAEAAAYVVVEAPAHAQARGAPALARVAGSAINFDPLAEPLAISDAAEAGRAQQDALGAAGYLQNQVDLLVSCADGRPTVDFAEGYAVRRIFGTHAHYLTVTAHAGALGGALAASGSLGAALAVESMRRDHVFAITGFETPEQDLDLAYAKTSREEKAGCVMVTALGVGGTDVALLLER